MKPLNVPPFPAQRHGIPLKFQSGPVPPLVSLSPQSIRPASKPPHNDNHHCCLQLCFCQRFSLSFLPILLLIIVMFSQHFWQASGVLGDIRAMSEALVKTAVRQAMWAGWGRARESAGGQGKAGVPGKILTVSGPQPWSPQLGTTHIISRAWPG